MEQSEAYLQVDASLWNRTLRDAIAAAALQSQTEVTLYGQVPKDGLFDALQDMLDEHPEIFWLSGRSSMSSSPGCRTLNLVPLYRMRDVPRMQEELQRSLHAVADYARQGSSGAERVARAYEWFCANVRYVPSALAFEDQTAYASLCLRQAVCAGISRGFQLVMAELGIQAGIVVGGADLRTLERHAWNYVVLEGQVLHLDVTAGVSFFTRTGLVGHPLYLLPTQHVLDFRHIRPEQELPLVGEDTALPQGVLLAPWGDAIRHIGTKKELRQALYLDVSNLCSPAGHKSALTLQIAPDLFVSQEEFRSYLRKLMGGSHAGMGFAAYAVYDGPALVLW